MLEEIVLAINYAYIPNDETRKPLFINNEIPFDEYNDILENFH